MLPPDSVRPDYHGYCLSSVPATAASILGVDIQRPKLPKDALGSIDTKDVDNVVLLLCDGLGYAEWKRHSDGLFGTLSRKGSVRPITTIYPSTTAAALTSVSTGLTPQEHGLPEWFVYLEEVGEVIASLPFSRMGDRRDSLEYELDPRVLFDGETIFQRLKRAGVRSTSLTTRSLANTAYSSLSRTGSDVSSYITASDMAVSLRRLVEASKGRNLFYVYWSYIDTIEHAYGPKTDEAEVEISLISHALQQGFLSKISGDAAKRTIFLVTADHGQLTISPEDTLYVNRFVKLMKSLNLSPSGYMIPPWGSARDMYLSVDDGRLEETKTYLEKKLAGIASVIKTDDAIADGLFGINHPSRKFRLRVGNLMVLPHGNRTVWYRYKKGESLEIRGHHGGLMTDEMTIPFAAARVSDLI